MPDLELSDDDILDAMRHIPGYIDITTSDFRAIYHLAHAHALERLFSSIRAGRLMRTGVDPAPPGHAARPGGQEPRPAGRSRACRWWTRQQRVVGMLTETDFLRRLRADTFLELLLRLVEDSGGFQHRCHETPVREAMTAPAVTVSEDATFRAIVRCVLAARGSHACPWSMPTGRCGGCSGARTSSQPAGRTCCRDAPRLPREDAGRDPRQPAARQQQRDPLVVGRRLRGIAAVAWVNQLLFVGTDLVLMIGSLGASAVLVFGAARSPLAQPRNVIGGHMRVCR